MASPACCGRDLEKAIDLRETDLTDEQIEVVREWLGYLGQR